MKYRKKPVVIEAVQWTGDNLATITEFFDETSDRVMSIRNNRDLFIETLEGEMMATPGDWIIKGIAGEFYPCKPDIFEATYDPVEE